jgi:hypothetical protein
MGHRLIVVSVLVTVTAVVATVRRRPTEWRNAFETGVALAVVGLAWLSSAMVLTPSGGVRTFTIAWYGGVMAIGVIGSTTRKVRGPTGNFKLALPFTLLATVVASAYTSWWLILGYFGALVLPPGAMVALVAVANKNSATKVYEARRKRREANSDD